MNAEQLEAFEEELAGLVNPEPDEDGLPLHEYPNRRLSEVYGLSFPHFEHGDWEGSSIHRYTRLCPHGHDVIHALTRSQDIPHSLFKSALLLVADSIVAHAKDPAETEGDLRYYPPAILACWSGFETFVRRASELFIATCKDVPPTVRDFLQEKEQSIDPNGSIRARTRYRPVLDRYAVLLRYGYSFPVDRGSAHWQRLTRASELRDYYTHLDVTEPRAISASEVIEFIEAVLLAIIWPSSLLERTLMLGVFDLYDLWELLHRNTPNYSERPFFLKWQFREQYLFHCNFENIDEKTFPDYGAHMREGSK